MTNPATQTHHFDSCTTTSSAAPAGADAGVSQTNDSRDVMTTACGRSTNNNNQTSTALAGAKKGKVTAPSALLCTERPLSIAEAKARRKLVLRATKSDNSTSFEEQWSAHPGQPLMPLIAELDLAGHRPHCSGPSLLGIAPEGPLCNWADDDDALLACMARRVKAAEIQAKPAAQEALKKERVRLERVPV